MLILLLKPVTFIVVTLRSLLTRLIFNTIAYTIVLLLQGLKGSGEGSLGIFQQVAECIRGCFGFILKLIIDSIHLLISEVFDILKDSIKGSAAASGYMAAELGEKLKTSIEESLKQVPELFQDFSNTKAKMVTELWTSYKDVVGYVTENS
ncbi:hypothetical protein VNO77_15849 [Canavalia gladiata]|uniref:Uncharacterized protein n=1 Tax=Canavalia gladiata TaxID=3824 RepID=A0AAN9M010_CANGL